MSLDVDLDLEQHRVALTGYCYRMLGSAFEAEDAVQETMVRAWRNADRFEGRSSLRTWLHRIATNVCFDFLGSRQRRARPMDFGHAAVSPSDPGEMLGEDLWLQPIPSTRAVPTEGDPAELAVARETIRLAFVAALQKLPPRQRAVLILRDALDWPADDTAAVLDMSLAAVNSALQRARATMQERLPERRLEWASASGAVEAERSLLQTYMEAFERHDDRELVALLREDVRMAMPPHPTWYEGREAVAVFLAEIAFRPDSDTHRFVPTRANRQPAFGVYRGDGPDAEPFAINVVEIRDGLIADMHFFLQPELFPAFGLPDTLG